VAVSVFASSLAAETLDTEQLFAVNVFNSTLAAETFNKEQFPAYKGPKVVVPVAFKVVVFRFDVSTRVDVSSVAETFWRVVFPPTFKSLVTVTLSTLMGWRRFTAP
jgi:hypothetical protein